MTTKNPWLASVSRELDLPEDLGPAVAEPVLALVRDVAHGIDRPSGPLTAYLVGVLVGRAASGHRVDPLGSPVVAAAEVDGFATGAAVLGELDPEVLVQETAEACELIRALVADHRRTA